MLAVVVALYVLAMSIKMATSGFTVGAIVLAVMGLPLLFGFLLFGSLFGLPIVAFALNSVCRMFWPKYERAYQFRRAVSEYGDAVEAFRQWQQKLHEQYWVSLDGISFEREVGALYRRQGYQVEFTPASSDGGLMRGIWCPCRNK